RQDRGDVAAFVHGRHQRMRNADVTRARARLDWRRQTGARMAGWLTTSKRGLAELRRRRVLRALGAYAVGGWLLLQIADATFEPLGLALWVQKALIIAVLAGIVPAAILAWIYDLTRHGVVRTPDGEARGLDGSGAPPAVLLAAS